MQEQTQYPGNIPGARTNTMSVGGGIATGLGIAIGVGIFILVIHALTRK